MGLHYTTLMNKTEMKSEYLGEPIYNLLDRTFIIPNRFNFRILKVDDTYIMRPDLISLDAYGDTMYADVICKLNGISPFEINTGMYLLLPDPADVMSFVTNADERYREISTEDTVVDLPVAKTKNQKRKANEAVVGDSRFNIDPVNGVIIY